MRILLFISFILIGNNIFSQNVVTLDPRQIESVPGEILIKLKDEVELGLNIQNGMIKSYDSISVLERIVKE